MATTAQRDHAHAWLTFLYQHRGQLDYPPGDQRDNRDAAFWHMSEQQIHHVLTAGGRLSFDCSELGAKACQVGGFWHWSAPGYTGTHLATLPHYSDARAARRGALAVFGGGTGHHEAIVYTPDPSHGNPLCAEHGRPGFDLTPLRAIEARQTAEGYPGVTLLSIAHL